MKVKVRTLIWVLKKFRNKIIIIYLSVTIESLLVILRPLIMGYTIDQLLIGNFWGVFIFITHYFIHLGIGTFRRVYDTKAYMNIYSQLCKRVIYSEFEKKENLSELSSKINLLGSFVNFLDKDLPFVLGVIYNISGSILMLAYFDKKLLIVCSLTLIPSIFINKRFLKANQKIITLINNLNENFLNTIYSKQRSLIEIHYSRLSKLRILTSNNGAKGFAQMEFFIIISLSIGLLIITQSNKLKPGEIISIYNYVFMFLTGYDVIPVMIEKINEILDLEKRLNKVKFD